MYLKDENKYKAFALNLDIDKFEDLYKREKILEKYFSKSLKKLENFNANFAKFGSIFAFFTFLPLVGDLFALGLGFAKYSFLKTIFFILLGKLSRYAFIIFIANSF